MKTAEKKLFSEKYFYEGDDLGISYSKEETFVRIWSPSASRIEILIFEAEEDTGPTLRKSLKREDRGTWVGNLDGDFSGFYYLFRLEFETCIKETIDPYAKAVGTNSCKGLIIDPDKTNPPGWENDKRIRLKSPLEAVIYELHVRDFSISNESGMKHKGKYLAFTESGSKTKTGEKSGLDHLKELGITHVHLLPVFDFATVEDCGGEYNWGYDPFLYNVPEGSYSTNPSDCSRIKEFKKLVKSLHDNGLGVIVDAVYNHTYHGEDSIFQKTVPNYFYRFVDGNFANGSGCGNEIASERLMVRKFIINSVLYWVKEYHVDGFRFDLMALTDRETMEEIQKEVHRIDPSILIYGEPWSAQEPQLDYHRQMRKGSQKGMKIAVFNDHFREAVKEGLRGGVDKKELKKGVVGAIDYDDEIRDFASEPYETINYVSCHDDLTIWDHLSAIYPDLNKAEKEKLNRLAQAVIFTSQGIPFIQGGEEFLRTKYGDYNSYNSGDHVNQLKWRRKSTHRKTFDYCRGLIELRRKHPAFRMISASQIRKNLEFINGPEGAVGFKITGNANGDSWKEIFVFYNFQFHWVQFSFVEKRRFGIVVNDDYAGTKVRHLFQADNVKIPPITAMVLKGMQLNRS